MIPPGAGLLLKNLPWGSIAKGAAVIGVVWFFYAKGAADKNTEWVNKENERIRIETEAKIKALTEKSKLDIEQAANTADRLARAEEQAKSQKSRADSAIENQNKTRSANYALAQNLKSAQAQAAANGDKCGSAALPAGVRDHFKTRLDNLRRRRPTNTDLRDKDRPAPAANADPELAGYPDAK